MSEKENTGIKTGKKMWYSGLDGFSFTDNFHKNKRQNQAEVITTYYAKSEQKKMLT